MAYGVGWTLRHRQARSGRRPAHRQHAEYLSGQTAGRL